MKTIKAKTATRKLKLELNKWNTIFLDAVTSVDTRVPETQKILDAWDEAIDKLEKQIQEQESTDKD